jgi:hypothetical protein
LIEKNKFLWILPLSVLAALNKESSILLPSLLLAYSILVQQKHPIKLSIVDKKQFLTALSAVVLFFLTYLILRIVIGPAAYATSGYGDIYPGAQLLVSNLRNGFAWEQLLLIFNILPLSLFYLKYLPNQLKNLVILFVIPWFMGQYFFGSVDEGRLFLVPLAVFFIPAFLLAMENRNRIIKQHQA